MIRFDVTTILTDRRKFLQRIESKRDRILARTGWYYSRTVKSLLRSTSTKLKPPPAPPRKKTGLLRDLVFFNVDPSDESVVIGPEKVAYWGDRYLKGGIKSVPELLQFGGSATVQQFGTSERVVQKYGARPYVDKKIDVLERVMAENIELIGLV